MRNLTEILSDKYPTATGWSVGIEFDEETQDYKQKTVEEQYERLEWNVEGIEKPTLESLLKLSKKPSKIENVYVKKSNKLVCLIKFILKYGSIIAAAVIAQKLITMV